MPMVLLCCNMDSKLRRVLPQMMGKVLLFCRSTQFKLKIAMATVFFLVHLLFNYLSYRRKTERLYTYRLLKCRNDDDDTFFKKESV